MTDTHSRSDNREQAVSAFDLLQADRANQRVLDRSVVSKIEQASPLAFDLVEAAGYHLPELVTAFRPGLPVANDNHGAYYSERLIASLASIAYAAATPFAEVLRDHRFLKLHRDWGMVLRLPSNPAGRLGVRVSGGLVDVRAMLGGSSLHLIGSRATLITNISSDICIADLKDRSVNTMIEHPLLVGPTYPVLGIVPLVATSERAAGHRSVVIVFDTGLVPMSVGAER